MTNNREEIGGLDIYALAPLIWNRIYFPDKTIFLEKNFWVDFLTVHDKPNIAELFHENSKFRKHGGGIRSLIDALGFNYLRYEKAQRLESDYNLPKVDLPAPKKPKIQLDKVLLERESTRVFSKEYELKLSELSGILRYSCGPRKGEEGFRTWPSAGALYPTSVFIAARRVKDLESAIYIYEPYNNMLYRYLSLTEDVWDEIDRSMAVREVVDIENASLFVFLVGTFWKPMVKYGCRAYRYVFIEAGHIGQNLYLTATAFGLGCVSIGGYYDDCLDEALLMDGIENSVIYVFALGKPGGETDAFGKGGVSPI